MPEPVIDVRRGRDRFWSTEPGIVSRHCFSYGPHYDPANVAHGALLVCNEDRMQSGRGYGDHPHAGAEIVTWVLSGSLHHADSYGNSGLIHRGLAQRMSAGRGIVHAERNDGYRSDPDVPAVPVHFVQMWIRPDERGGPPSYEQREVAVSDLSGDWLPVVSGGHPDAAVSLASRGSTLWVSVLEPGSRRNLPEAPYVHAFVARGEVAVETVGRLAAGDALRLTGPAALRMTGVAEAELLVWTTAG